MLPREIHLSESLENPKISSNISERERVFFFSPIFTLERHWGHFRGRKASNERKMIILRDSSATAFFFFLYYDAKKFKYDLRDLSQPSPLVIHPYWGVSFFSPQPGEWGDVTGTYRHWHPPPQPTKWNWHLSFASSSLGSQDQDSE